MMSAKFEIIKIIGKKEIILFIFIAYKIIC